MRISKKEKTEVDLSTPLNADNFKIVDGDCFGSEWKPDSTECSACHDIDVCGILYAKRKVEPRSKEIKKELGRHFLDDVNFNRIDKNKLVELIKSKEGEMTSTDFLTYIKHYSRCEDSDTVLIWVKEFKLEFPQIKIKKGLVSYE